MEVHAEPGESEKVLKAVDNGDGTITATVERTFNKSPNNRDMCGHCETKSYDEVYKDRHDIDIGVMKASGWRHMVDRAGMVKLCEECQKRFTTGTPRILQSCSEE